MNNKRSSTYVLGISCYYHDSAACLVKDGNIVAAAQEERFSRIKHDPRFPDHAIKYCHEEAGITYKDFGQNLFLNLLIALKINSISLFSNKLKR